MEVTDELRDYDCFKEKKFSTKYIGFFFYCTVCLSVTSSSHTSEAAKNILEYDSKNESQKFHFFYMFSDYVMFLFRNKSFYSRSIFQLGWSCCSFIFWFLEMKIWPICFVVSIGKYSVTFSSWKSSEKKLLQNTSFKTLLELLLCLHLKIYLCPKIHISF